MSLDGTKIKAKTSINKLTDENQIIIMKEHLKKSIEIDQGENEELCDESGNSIPESLTDKDKFKKTVKEIQKSSKNDRNKDKLRSSSLNLLKQAKSNPEKVLKKNSIILKKKLKESPKDVTSINDPDTHLMRINKANRNEITMHKILWTNTKEKYHIIHYTKSNRPFRINSFNETIRIQFN